MQEGRYDPFGMGRGSGSGGGRLPSSFNVPTNPSAFPPSSFGLTVVPFWDHSNRAGSIGGAKPSPFLNRQQSANGANFGSQDLRNVTSSFAPGASHPPSMSPSHQMMRSAQVFAVWF